MIARCSVRIIREEDIVGKLILLILRVLNCCFVRLNLSEDEFHLISFSFDIVIDFE